MSMFQSTPPARAATGRTGRRGGGHGVSIHAAREGGDADVTMFAATTPVSIHAAREGGDWRIARP